MAGTQRHTEMHPSAADAQAHGTARLQHRAVMQHSCFRSRWQHRSASKTKNHRTSVVASIMPRQFAHLRQSLHGTAIKAAPMLSRAHAQHRTMQGVGCQKHCPHTHGLPDGGARIALCEGTMQQRACRNGRVVQGRDVLFEGLGDVAHADWVLRTRQLPLQTALGSHANERRPARPRPCRASHGRQLLSVKVMEGEAPPDAVHLPSVRLFSCAE